MNSLLKKLQNALPNKHIVDINNKSLIVDEKISISFCPVNEEEKIKILNRVILGNKEFVNTKSHKYLVVSNNVPPRIKLMNPGQDIPRNHYPIASWDNDNNTINLAISKASSDSFIEDILISGLPMLINIVPSKENFMPLCEGMSLGIEQERKNLQSNEEQNRRTGNEYLNKAKEYLEKADRQARIIEQLSNIEKTSSYNSAKQQWQDMVELIPHALQNIQVKNGYIEAITTPIILLGNFMGIYLIKIVLKTGDITIHGISKDINNTGYPHPHVRADGGVCWGSLVNRIAELKSCRDYFNLINAALRLLNSYNRGDQYISLDKWGTNYSGTIEETVSRDCQNRGPGYSLLQAKKCIICSKTNPNCQYTKNNNDSIYKACYTLSAPQECTSCKETECQFFHNRFIRCWSLMEKQGPAWCMLKCEHVDCPFKPQAQTICSNNNKRENGTCPASNKCWMPCVNKE